jgi:hypothetical protein
MAGHIPKEVTSINRDMVRTHTFNPVDLERILSRPVCLRSSLPHLIPLTNPCCHVPRICIPETLPLWNSGAQRTRRMVHALQRTRTS